jgi:heptosyltransferase-2
MAAIRENFPRAKITLLSTPGPKGAPGAEEILTGASFLDEMIIYHQGEAQDKNKLKEILRNLKAKAPDLFIELPQNQERMPRLLRDMALARYLGAKYAFGFEVASLKIFGKAQSEHLRFDNEVVRLLKILKKEGLKLKEPFSPLNIPEEDKLAVRSFLIGKDISKLFVFNIGAKRQTNIWPLERFAEAGKWLISEYKAVIVIIGGKAERESAENLKNMIGGPGVLVAAGALTILQTIELLKQCRLLISNDTGAVHMASAVGVPVVGIYCAWQQRGKWYPFGQGNIVLRKEPVCHTCFKKECDHLTCIKMIGVEEVKEAVQRLSHSAEGRV